MLGIVVVMRDLIVRRRDPERQSTIPCENLARIVLGTLLNVGIQMKHTTSRTGTRKQLTVACCELEEKYRCALNVHLMGQI